MNLKTLADIDIRGKRVIFRTSYDVPLTRQHERMIIADDTRIRATLPSLRYLLRKKCKIIILTWLNRPGGKVIEKDRLDCVAQALSDLIKRPVRKLDSCIGPAVESALKEMKPQDIVMLENVRFHSEEESGSKSFAAALAKYGDCVVFDAFAQSHRDCPSTTGILSLLPSVCGMNMAEEYGTLSSLLTNPQYPFVVVLGGAKISDKVEMIKHLLPIADCILLGGALAHNFLKARGLKIAASQVESRRVGSKKNLQRMFELAEELLEATQGTFIHLGANLTVPKLVIPIDLVAASKLDPIAKTKIVNLTEEEALPWNWMYLDIGPRTIEYYTSIIGKAKTVFWNGPLGYAEIDRFAEGSRKIADAMAHTKAKTIIGGGDTELLLRKWHLSRKMSFVSTGGGAALHLLAGKELPVLNYLSRNT